MSHEYQNQTKEECLAAALLENVQNWDMRDYQKCRLLGDSHRGFRWLSGLALDKAASNDYKSELLGFLKAWL